MAMLTKAARQIRTGGMKYSAFSARGNVRATDAKRFSKRLANRSERHFNIQLAEYGSEADDAMMAKMAEEFSDNEYCSYCRSSGPAHHFFWVKRFEAGACDCCEHFAWVPVCTSCCTPPGLNNFHS